MATENAADRMPAASKHQSIRGKLTRIILISCGLAVVSACAIFATYDIRTVRQSRLRTVATLAEITGTNSEAALTFSDEQAAKEILRSSRADKQVTHAALYMPNGKVLAVYSRDLSNGVFTPPPIEADGARFAAGKIVALHTVELDGKPAGTIYLESDLSTIVAREERLAAMVGLALLVSLLLAGLVGSRLQSSISGPILELARTAFAIAVDKDYSVRMESKTGDEIGFLYEQFNAMLGRIQDRDIELERARAELERRVDERTNYLSALIEGSPLAIVVTDQNGTVRSANPAFTRIFGYLEEEIKGGVLDNFLAPGELYVEATRITHGRKEGGSVHLVTRRARKDGSLVDVEVYGLPLCVHGEIVGGFALYQDITERKQAEEQLAERTSYLNTLIETSPLGIVAGDANGLIKICNSAFERLFRCVRAEVIGMSLTSLVTPPERSEESAGFVRRLTVGETVHATTQRRRSDGTLVDVELYCGPLHAGGGQSGFLVLYQDITERKRAEEELAERTAYLNTLIEASPLGIVAVDTEGRIKMCNSAFERLFQYVRAEVTGVNLNSLVTPRECREESAEFARRRQSGETVQATTQRRRNDGTLLDVELYGVPMRVGGEEVGTLVIYHDISERRKADEALRNAKERAEAANRAKSEFLANMSHEIRTPMNGILGMTQLTLETKLNDEQREYLGMVKSSADSLLMLLNDILDFSKIEAGKLDLELSPFALRESLGEALKALGHLAHRRGLELAWHVDAGVPTWLMGDSGRLRQILVNLVMNAIKFTERGEVVVSVKVESETPQEVELHFSVRDTGIGIPAEKRELIFAAFTQADSSTTRKYGGTGLGLTISQALVKMMNGSISVESEPRHGSIFHFTARLKVPEASFIPPAVVEPAALRGLRALVVDDNQTNRLILTELLTQWGMAPEQAASGAEALKLLAGEGRGSVPFRLALIDADMPGMDGFALAERVKATSEASALSMFMLSSTTLSSDIARSHDAGLAGFLTKPVQPSELLDAILAVMSSTEKMIPDALDIQSAPQISNRGNGMRILLAEDNVVNRQLAARLLEKRGYTVVIAKNGIEALAAVERERIDMVLMDVQMPEMDGLEAIRVIRSNEKISKRHLPIISLTAHVMKGDREKCIEAGADDYIPKPIQPANLFAAMERMCPSRRDDNQPHVAAPAIFDSLNTAELLERVQGDRELLAEIVQLFEIGLPAILQGLRESIAREDAVEIARVAHTLKGSVGNFGRGAAYRAVEEMESLAKESNMARAAKAFVVVESELKELLAMLEPFRTPAVEAGSLRRP